MLKVTATPIWYDLTWWMICDSTDQTNNRNNRNGVHQQPIYCFINIFIYPVLWYYIAPYLSNYVSPHPKYEEWPFTLFHWSKPIWLPRNSFFEYDGMSHTTTYFILECDRYDLVVFKNKTINWFLADQLRNNQFFWLLWCDFWRCRYNTKYHHEHYRSSEFVRVRQVHSCKRNLASSKMLPQNDWLAFKQLILFSDTYLFIAINLFINMGMTNVIRNIKANQ